MGIGTPKPLTKTSVQKTVSSNNPAVAFTLNLNSRLAAAWVVSLDATKNCRRAEDVASLETQGELSSRKRLSQSR